MFMSLQIPLTTEQAFIRGLIESRSVSRVLVSVRHFLGVLRRIRVIMYDYMLRIQQVLIGPASSFRFVYNQTRKTCPQPWRCGLTRTI